MKNKIFDLNVPKSLRRSSGIRDHDFDPWFNILTWATGVSNEDKLVLRILLKRIRDMYISQGRRKNLRFVHHYLKEVYTICTSLKVKSAYTPKLGVRRGTITGIPLIIPGRIRERMLSDRRLYITTMTMLGIHRIIPGGPAVDLGSIVNDFNGRYRTMSLDMILASKRKLCELAKAPNYRFLKLKALVLFPQSSGPNMPTAYYGVFIDTIGIVKYPSYMISLIRWYWLTRSGAILVSFLSMVMLALGFTFWVRACGLAVDLINFLLNQVNYLKSLHLKYSAGELLFKDAPVDTFDFLVLKLVSGVLKLLLIFFNCKESIDIVNNAKLSRLSVVYNTAGKARVIGITNYGVQVALYPLHREIFKFLRRLPTDGTFNQLSPIWALPATGREYYSFDLTAATDRLPRDLQVDILKSYVDERLACLWGRLVDMPFEYDGDIIKYAIGQPMGAYSSGAMLALTHHTIVQSHYSHGPERDYAILGDDVVVPEYLASHYKIIMESLGVSISMAKSIVSKEMVEFAKRVRTVDGDDLSIIGPGLIMAGVRNRGVSALALAEACKKGLQRGTSAPEYLKKLPGFKPGDSLFGSLVLFGPRPLIVDSQVNVVFPPGKARAISDPAEESKYVRSYMADFLIKEEKGKYERKLHACRRSLDVLKLRFKAHLLDILSPTLIPGILKFLSLCISPTTGYIIREAVATLGLGQKPEEMFQELKGDSLSIIRQCLAGNPDLIGGLDEPPTNQKVVSSRRFLTRYMNSFPGMEGLKPKVTIPFKGSSLDRANPFLEEAFPNLHNPFGIKSEAELIAQGQKPNPQGFYKNPKWQVGWHGGDLNKNAKSQKSRKGVGGKHIFVNL